MATGNSGGYEEGQIPLAVAEPVQGGPSTLVCPTKDDSTMWNSTGEQLCVVCQFFPLSRALLPCRYDSNVEKSEFNIKHIVFFPDIHVFVQVVLIN